MWVSDMKRAAPSLEPQDVSSGSSSSDSGQEGKGGNVSTAAATAEGESSFLPFKVRSLEGESYPVICWLRTQVTLIALLMCLLRSRFS